ncbi:MAG: TrbC/VirB2 family protein [Erythrobacter sp.]
MAIETAVQWLLALLSGSLVTYLLGLAIGIAAIGMLFGHISARRTGQIVLGSFILVGAGEIAQALILVAPQPPLAVVFENHEQPRVLPPAPPPTPSQAGNPFDPYSGDQATN